MTANFMMDYHQPAFELIHDRYRPRFYAALHEEPRRQRRKFLLENLPVGLPVDPERTWEVGKKLLDQLEASAAAQLQKRDNHYWLHIYRRLAVMLSSLHENNTGPMTTGLVRRMVELAIFKYGSEKAKNELWSAKNISSRLILGGWYHKGLKHLRDRASVEQSTILEKWDQQLKGGSSVVIKDFGISDIETIYFVEGIFYQYWFVTALLRSVGKGAKITLNSDGDWVYADNNRLQRLIISYDERVEESNAHSLLAGVWIRDAEDNNEIQLSKSVFRERIMVPAYNLSRAPLTEAMHFPSYSVSAGVIPNFLLSSLDLKQLLDAAAFLDKPFQKQHSFALSELCSVIAALSSITLMPEWVLQVTDENARNWHLSNCLHQLVKRGYSIGLKIDDFSARIERRLPELGLPDIEPAKIDKILQFISLSDRTKAMISPWSGGPRPLLIETKKYRVIDLVGIYDFLSTLFVGVRSSNQLKGDTFESLIRADLEEKGYNVISGKKWNKNNEEREIDAAVLKDGTLLLFECFSAERPMDFELGKPSVLNGPKDGEKQQGKANPGRNSSLQAKLDQAQTARDFFLTNKVGRNYDFSGVAKIEHFVVSPFVEWIWGDDDALWFDSRTPRIICPSEMQSILSGIGDA